MNAQWRKQFENQKHFCRVPDNGLCERAQCRCAKIELSNQIEQKTTQIGKEGSFFVSLYSEYQNFNAGNLHKHPIQKVANFYQRKITSIKEILNVFGTVEYQHTKYVDQYGWQDPYCLWQGHFHGMVNTRLNKQQLTMSLIELFPATYYAQVPVYVQNITRWPLQTTYLVKECEKTHHRIALNGVLCRDKWRITGDALKEMNEYLQNQQLEHCVVDYRKKKNRV